MEDSFAPSGIDCFAFFSMKLSLNVYKIIFGKKQLYVYI